MVFFNLNEYICLMNIVKNGRGLFNCFSYFPENKENLHKPDEKLNIKINTVEMKAK